jgi:Fur family peroxide stress response transcriptional regulator
MKHLIQKLRQHKISVTPQRLAVLATLTTRRDHPTAEQIYQEVRRQHPAISFNTVYKTLEVLHEKGLIIKVNPLHEAARYDGQPHHHVHLICRRCHHIYDLEGDFPLIRIAPEQLPEGFRVESQSLAVWGVCRTCQENTVNA